MSWYRLPNGRPWYAVDGSNLALRLIGEGATVLAEADVAAARAAWDNRTPGPAGTAPDFVTQGQLTAALEALRAELANGGAGLAPLTLTDNGDGTATVTLDGLNTLVDNGDGTAVLTISAPHTFVDNGDGTATLTAA